MFLSQVSLCGSIAGVHSCRGVVVQGSRVFSAEFAAGVCIMCFGFQFFGCREHGAAIACKVALIHRSRLVEVVRTMGRHDQGSSRSSSLLMCNNTSLGWLGAGFAHHHQLQG